MLAKGKVLVPSWETCRSLFGGHFEFVCFIKFVIHDNSIRSRAIIVIMDLFLILTQFSYIMYTREREESIWYHKSQYNHQYGRQYGRLWPYISHTEVTFLEISGVIVIQVKNILCELIITFFIGTSQITFHIYQA